MTAGAAPKQMCKKIPAATQNSIMQTKNTEAVAVAVEASRRHEGAT